MTESQDQQPFDYVQPEERVPRHISRPGYSSDADLIALLLFAAGGMIVGAFSMWAWLVL